MSSSTEGNVDFWTRQGFEDSCREKCMRVLRDVYGMYEVEEFGEQGFCSFTALATPLRDGGTTFENDTEEADKKELVIQLRPVQYALDLDIARAASATYWSMAPRIRCLDLDLPEGLHAYQMQRLHGTPFSRLKPCWQTLDSDTDQKIEQLVTSLASIIAQSWPGSSQQITLSRDLRADSPMEDLPNMLSRCTGKVGSSIISRVRKLALELPDAQLRDRAQSTLEAIRGMVDYPVMLNHGDFIPSNILVNEDTWEVTGLVDWAEAEILPFGTCLYGLEHLLGFMDTPPSDGHSQPNGRPVYKYFEKAAKLRELFWIRLLDAVPELRGRVDDVKVMRDLGVLLWRGIAWDNGAIDRVVNDMDDAEELACLRAFLNAS
ncbi:hypothetical protein J1614_006858 [Plenodomus biglobosus]|nr:hypothetical protein J1614_006858 [Plenodomus biglobosus]